MIRSVMPAKNKDFFFQQGQTLLEVAMALGIALIIISALTIVTLEGLKNSQFSQNQTQATQLAQEGLEKVKSMRDRDYSINVGGASYAWSTYFQSPAYPSAPGACGTSASGCKFSLGVFSGTIGSGSGTNCAISSTGAPDPTKPTCLLFNGTPEKLVNNHFIRTINIYDCRGGLDLTCPTSDPANSNLGYKKVFVTVSWTDSSGIHNSNLVTILGDLKQ
jgi:hypothetical protein